MKVAFPTFYMYCKPHKYTMSGRPTYNVFENNPGVHLGDFQYFSSKKCMFRDSRELPNTMLYVNN